MKENWLTVVFSYLQTGHLNGDDNSAYFMSLAHMTDGTALLYTTGINYMY